MASLAVIVGGNLSAKRSEESRMWRQLLSAQLISAASSQGMGLFCLSPLCNGSCGDTPRVEGV